MPFDQILTAETFIQAYRKIEKSKPQAAEDIIRYVVKDKGVAEHLCSSWRGRKQDWGDFYLNLSQDVQYKILKFWELGDTKGDEYIKRMEANPMAMLWADPPECIQWPHELLKFFYNHGIEEKPAKGVSLSTLPAEDKRFGNSSNWGDYILSLQDIEKECLLKEIADYSLDPRK